MFWKKEGEKVRCLLCPHGCLIADSNTGICNVRKNEGGVLIATTHGKVASMHADPMEKKPLYHFKPGSMIYSLGTVGCNLKCMHCQNWQISQSSPGEFYIYDVGPEKVAGIAVNEGCRSVAFTYNEPTIWYEYIWDCGPLLRKENLDIVWVTNGFINEEPLRQMLPFIDAVNVDVKAFTEAFYKNISRAKLEPVKRTCGILVKGGKHVELTYLVIPGHNDADEEFEQFSRWVVDELGPDIPVHFSKFHPDYKMSDVPPTPPARLKSAHDISRKQGLNYVYIGNVSSISGSTRCPSCSAVLIDRTGYSTRIVGMDGNKCSSCKKEIPIIL